MVTGVSSLIHVYSVGYMKGEEGYARYFMLLNLFVFSMLMLVMAANLPLMYLGWEGVGFCSYALIGFWYKDPANATAGRKAFIVTRIGDVSFGVALIWLFYFAGGTSIAEINSQAVSTMPEATATAIGLLLLFGAAGKSAQLPLTVWLPDAMAGPTPVSALIHAATMVTAGVYLLMRLFPVIHVSSTAMAVIAATGALTAFYAATAALAQRDIKKVLAYSTISQIGYMVMGVGAGALAGSLFHLFVHAFFKAGLFMAAGCVIVALHEEHDIFKMGGLMGRMPAVFWSFLACALALSAAPGTGGFFSKDEILAATFNQGSAFYVALWALGEVTAFITAFYIFRVVCLVFLGEAKSEPRAITPVMTLTLIPLAVLALLGGLINLPSTWGGGERLFILLESHGLSGSAAVSHSWALQIISAAVSVFGVALSYYMYAVNPVLRGRLAVRFSFVTDFLYAAWYLDRFYYRLLVAPYGRAAEFLWRKVDEGSIDRAMDGTGSAVARAGSLLRASVTGRASTYILATVAGAALILVYFTWSIK
jgi:NADH-quinone oxidoreductase subunit L